MIKYDAQIVNECKKLFPENTKLHEMVINGDPKAADVVFQRVGFSVDEDDILRAFRNKNESQLLLAAKRAKAIRTLYSKMFFIVDRVDEV